MQLIQHQKAKQARVDNIVVPQSLKIVLHQCIIEHLEVCKQDIRRSIKDGVSMLYDMILLHDLRVLPFWSVSLTNKKAGAYSSSQSFVFVDNFCQSFCLVGCQCIHGIHDDHLDTRAMLLTETVVQNRIEKSLGFSRARTCGDDGWFGFFTLSGKPDPGVYLMIVGCPVRFYGQRNLINRPLFRFYKW